MRVARSLVLAACLLLAAASHALADVTVFLGSATDHHRGPVNLSQFGKGQWQASRS
jgi:hypothetical protein